MGAPTELAGTQEILTGFHASLGLDPDAKLAAVYARLREDTPKHKLHESDRWRYERAFENFVDALWNVDCAIGGLSAGGIEPARCYVFVGVYIEGIEHNERDDSPAASTRPRWLKKGDLTMGSDLAKELGPDAAKEFRHAAQMYRRANKEILTDATTRVARLPVSRQHDPSWALVRWLVQA